MQHKGSKLRTALGRFITVLKLKKDRFYAKHFSTNPVVKLFALLAKGITFAGKTFTFFVALLLFQLYSLFFHIVTPVVDFLNRYLWQPMVTLMEDMGRKKSSRGAVGVSIMLACACVWTVMVLDVGIQVKVDGQVVGFVKSQDDINDAVALIENQTADLIGRPYVLDADIDFSFQPTAGADFISGDKALQLSALEMSRFLSANVDEISTLAVVTVDGEMVGALKTEEECKAVFERIAETYTGGDPAAQYEFLEEVDISVVETGAQLAMTADQLYNELTATDMANQVYKVQKGDTLSRIASRNNMKTSEILGLNPGINPAKIFIGDEVTISAPEPSLSVKVVKAVSYTEKIAYETVKKKNDAMALNQTKTVTPGQNGTASIAAEVVYINGVEADKTILSKTVLTKPTDAVIEVGTKNISQGTGTMRTPFKGKVTSNYGYRGREFHTGVDLAGPRGSSIVAADSGKVTFSGWNGNYGYCVIISHGKGLETLYAHNSSNLVQVGQSVEKGEVIAKVGSTGRSTGNHLHFEVRVNGRHVSPRKYISY